MFVVYKSIVEYKTFWDCVKFKHGSVVVWNIFFEIWNIRSMNTTINESINTFLNGPLDKISMKMRKYVISLRLT